MTQKASRLPTATDRLKQHSTDISNLYALGRVRLVPRSIEAPSQGAAPVGGSVGGSGAFLPTGGGSMIGPLALDSPDNFRIIIDVNNTINVGQSSENEQYSSNLQLDSIQPNSSVLDTIAGAAFDGQILVLRTFAPDPITISQATLANGGNIQTLNDTDFTIGDLQTITLIFDASLIVFDNAPGGTWRVVTGDGGGGGISFPLLYPKEDLTPSILFNQTIDLSISTGNAKQIQFPAGDIGLQIIGDPSNVVSQEVHIMFIQDSIGNRSLVAVDTTIKNGNLMDTLLDKDANAKTTFKLITLDGGVSYHAELVDLTSSDLSLWANFPAVSNVDFNGKSAQNVLALDIEDSVGDTRLSISGPLGIGARFSFVSGDSVFFTENITDRLQIDSTGIKLLSNDITMGGGDILKVQSLGSDGATVPGSGFIRMEATDQIRWKNTILTDDLYINVERPTLDATTQDAFAFTVSGGVQLYIGSGDISVEDNDIIKTGNITPGAGAHEVGTTSDSYNQMHSQFFVPDAAAIVLNRYGLSRVGDRLYVNYDNINADAGFGIYEEGLQQFLFSNPVPNTIELFIGPAIFTSGETYRIQLGENSNSSAKIEFTEGNNDLIIERQGTLTSGAIDLRTGGFSRLTASLSEIKFFQDMNVNSQDITNVANVKADTSGTSRFGEFQPSNGGFDYILRDKIFWESNSVTFIQFNVGGIHIISDDELHVTSKDTQIYDTINTATGFDFNPFNSLAVSIRSNQLTLQDGVNLFIQTNFASFTEITTPITPGTNEGRFYAKDVGSVTTPMWLDSVGTETSMLGGGSLIGTQPFHTWESHDTIQFNFEVYMANSMQGGNLLTILFPEDQIRYVPFFLSKRSKIVRMGIDVVFSSGLYTLEFAVYSNRTDGQNYPETQLGSSSTPTSGIGAKTVFMSPNITLDPGLYWFAVLCNNNSTLTVRAVSEGHGNCAGYTDGGALNGFTEIMSYEESSTIPMGGTADDENIPSTEGPLIFAKFNPA